MTQRQLIESVIREVAQKMDMNREKPRIDHEAYWNLGARLEIARYKENKSVDEKQFNN